MITSATSDRITTITLDRPERHNALTTVACHDLADAVHAGVSTGTRAILLTGTGSSFCSGADLSDAIDRPFRDALYAMLHAVADAPVPVVAAVHGPAIGAGAQLAIAADLRITGPHAVFAVPTARIGLSVDPWTIQRLVGLAGHGTARSILLGSRRIGAAEALRCGLADEAGDLDRALDQARAIAGLAPLTVRYSKKVLNALIAQQPVDDPELDAAFEACWRSDDLREGRLAIAERRSPVFEGR